jgi:ankyrin repeat protein
MTTVEPRVSFDPARAAGASIGLLVLLVSACCTTKAGSAADLLAAASAGREAEALEALAGGADPNVKDGEGRTALMYAARSGLTELVGALIRKAANLDAQAGDGRTALMEAAAGCHEPVAALLLRNGVRKDLRDAHGRTAADHLPAQPACPEVRDLLRD